jgi:hypothetical protein
MLLSFSFMPFAVGLILVAIEIDLGGKDVDNLIWLHICLVR